jgi:hypothetical protein
VLYDEDLAAAILDRVLERGRFIHLGGPSGRTRHLSRPKPIGSEFPEVTAQNFRKPHGRTLASAVPRSANSTRPGKGLVGLLPIGGGFTRRGDISRARALQELLCLRRPNAVVAVHRKQDSTVFDPAFVTFGFVFRNAQAD